MTNYPAQIDNSISLPKVTDQLTPVKADTVNRLRDAIVAVEAELGVKPSATYSTVRARLDALEGILDALDPVQINQDLGGTPSNPLVIGLYGNPISSVDPVTNEVLTWNGLAWEALPPQSSIEITLGGDLGGTNTSQIVVGLRSRPIAATAPATGQVLTWSGSTWYPADASGSITFSGDLSGNESSQTVTGLQSNPVSTADPSIGDFLGWDGSFWTPTSGGTVDWANPGSIGSSTPNFGRFRGVLIGDLSGEGSGLNDNELRFSNDITPVFIQSAFVSGGSQAGAIWSFTAQAARAVGNTSRVGGGFNFNTGAGAWGGPPAASVTGGLFTITLGVGAATSNPFCGYVDIISPTTARGTYLQVRQATGSTMFKVSEKGIDYSAVQRGPTVVTVTYSSSMTFDALAGNHFVITITNGTGFTINNPTNPPSSSQTQEITIEFINSSGGTIGTVNFDTDFKLDLSGGPGSPLFGPSDGSSTVTKLKWTGTKWTQISPTTADLS